MIGAQFLHGTGHRPWAVLTVKQTGVQCVAAEVELDAPTAKVVDVAAVAADVTLSLLPVERGWIASHELPEPRGGFAGLPDGVQNVHLAQTGDVDRHIDKTR